ncbi:hypothetical protein RRSWK_05945 [Rhodopirellula sp. SWK7]|nr:hypothetical protein RRSWK_05945 [Rhodopirellula sp. SWK7]
MRLSLAIFQFQNFVTTDNNPSRHHSAESSGRKTKQTRLVQTHAIIRDGQLIAPHDASIR